MNNENNNLVKMEVHHHAHTQRKKWKHYIWEFLMLFLAVFCGFLAENQREHYVEHQREKQYMRSMMEDLMLDTAEFNSRLAYIDKLLIPVFQSSKELLYRDQFSDTAIRQMYAAVPQCSRIFNLTVQDRTMNQLRNSGNFRIIRNKTVTDSLATYWKRIDGLNNWLLPAYDLSRIEVKNISYALFRFDCYKDNNPFSGEFNRDVSPTLLSRDKREFIKLANFISNLHSQANLPIRNGLMNARQQATDLIKMIRENYHIK